MTLSNTPSPAVEAASSLRPGGSSSLAGRTVSRIGYGAM